ncbi:DUF2461 domain-containing protein [Parafilimonas sp.]|uniref:DUF2461 domain-containing protein n=1 Tax=Parafilimonas sp. TaxID=1969739 RepID=UPI0039E4F83E
MLQTSTLQFLKQLANNNNKEWFDANRKKYEAAKQDHIQSIQKILNEFSKTDTTLSSLAAKDCLFRINRDIRFSKDKSPYKINFGASINAGGRKSFKAGYYLHIQPGESFAGGGLYQPFPDILKKLRQEIDYNFDEFKGIISHKKFKSVYTKGISKDAEYSLSRPPKGYEDNNPAIEFIKLKSIVAIAPLTDAQVTDKKFTSTVIKAFEALHPLIVFLNKATEV